VSSTGAPRAQSLTLAAIGVLGGFLGALFGVGGGIVLVPFLLAHRFPPRVAAATSLAAIPILSIAGAITYGLHGDLKLGAAAVIGVPAVAGVIAGAALQQRLPTRALAYGFAIVLVAVGVRLLV
jgi:uncharacterized protein